MHDHREHEVEERDDTEERSALQELGLGLGLGLGVGLGLGLGLGF